MREGPGYCVSLFMVNRSRRDMPLVAKDSSGKLGPPCQRNFFKLHLSRAVFSPIPPPAFGTNMIHKLLHFVVARRAVSSASVYPLHLALKFLVPVSYQRSR